MRGSPTSRAWRARWRRPRSPSTPRSSSRSRTWRERLANRADDLRRIGEPAPRLLGDLAIADPDGELARVADLERRVDAEGLLQFGRRTGGLGQIPSTAAVADLDR